MAVLDTLVRHEVPALVGIELGFAEGETLAEVHILRREGFVPAPSLPDIADLVREADRFLELPCGL